MDITRALVVPESWYHEAADEAGRLKFQSSCRVVPVPDYQNIPLHRLSGAINKALNSAEIKSVLVILPNRLASGKKIKYWPELWAETKTGILVSSVLFADSWIDCEAQLRIAVFPAYRGNQTCYATCQYQPPYTEIFDRWVEAGAKGLHPGDYFKPEFLDELSRMDGHWMYWGHSDGSRLRGYHHLFTNDLLNYKPESPLLSTLWFSCAALDENKKHPIALDWFLSGSTHCLMASSKQINTKDNQLLALAWAEACQQLAVPSVDTILLSLLANEKSRFRAILKNYRLLGNLWVNFSI